MNHQTIEQMVEWLTPDEYGNGVMADVTLDYTKSTAIRAALTARGLPVDGNRLPLEEIPEGWKFLELCAAINNRFYVELMRAKAGGFPPYERKLAYGATPAEALRAAIAAAAKDGAS